MSYEKLLADLGALHKSMPADLSAGPAVDDGLSEEERKKKADADAAGAAPMAKSLTVKLADGSDAEVLDGEALVKALSDRVDADKAEATGAFNKVLEVVAHQATLIKSLATEVTALKGAGTGRKATITIVPPAGAGDLTKSQDKGGLNANEFMAKAESAMSAGRITGRDLSIAEAALNNRQAVPEEIVSRVLAQ